MIRIRGFARKTRRLTKGGSLPAPTREVSAREGHSIREEYSEQNMGNNGHSNGNGQSNGNGTDILHRNGASDRPIAATADRLGHLGNGSNGNGSNAISSYLHSVVEELIDPTAPIEGRSPLDGNGQHAAIDGQSVPNLETLFARAAISTQPTKCIPRWKRVFDVTCIVMTLPIWLPVLLLAMAWIKLVSPGPIFYRQERIGHRGRRFMIFKFRTMHVNAETRCHEEYFAHLMSTDTPMTKLDAMDDSRLIRCGRLLRAAGLDELPQLFNVLRGDMSLVGPRPCLPNEFQRYTPAQRQRVNAPPGLTGYWQVNGKNNTTFSEMITMDVHYSEHMSVWLDVAIICKTIPALLGQTMQTRVR